MSNSIRRGRGSIPTPAGTTNIQNDYDNYDQHLINALLSIAAQLCLRLSALQSRSDLYAGLSHFPRKPEPGPTKAATKIVVRNNTSLINLALSTLDGHELLQRTSQPRQNAKKTEFVFPTHDAAEAVGGKPTEVLSTQDKNNNVSAKQDSTIAAFQSTPPSKTPRWKTRKLTEFSLSTHNLLSDLGDRDLDADDRLEHDDTVNDAEQILK